MTTRTSTDPWVRLARITAVIGLSSFVLLFGTIIPLAAVGEPPFTASNDEATQLGLAVLWLACGAPDCLGELGVAGRDRCDASTDDAGSNG